MPYLYAACDAMPHQLSDGLCHARAISIKNNFKTGPVWDTDKFSTNLVAHPYHGSLYFNAARSNGMNFWQSIPFAAGGSLMWEFFMENEPPSINDLMATTFGGVELGEITYLVHQKTVESPYPDIQAEHLAGCQPGLFRHENSRVAHVISCIHFREVLPLHPLC